MFETNIKCVKCNGEYVHRYRTELFERVSEDGPGRHITIKNYDDIEIDNDMHGNPSSRRDGIKMSFYCEKCPAITVVSIMQHKGWEIIECSHGGERLQLEPFPHPPIRLSIPGMPQIPLKPKAE